MVQYHVGPGLPTCVQKHAASLALLVIAGLFSCSHDVASVSTPATLLVVSGDGQTGVVGKPLPMPVIIGVVDFKGNEVAGALVGFAVTSGGGTVVAAGVETNNLGLAESRWTLGRYVTENQRLEARLIDAKTGQTIAFVIFTAESTADFSVMITKLAGDNQLVEPGELAAESLAVILRDAYGNAGSGTVVWNVTRGTGSVSPATSNAGADGIARTQFRAGALGGAQCVSAAAGGDVSAVFAAGVYESFQSIAAAADFWTDGVIQPRHTCGVTNRGVFCWGADSEALGTTDFDPVSCDPLGFQQTVSDHCTLPMPVSGGIPFSSVTTGGWHSCGLTADGAAYCWRNPRGAAGTGSWDSVIVPTPVSGGIRFQEVSAGWEHTCGLTPGGIAYCWGLGRILGTRDTTDSNVPRAVEGGLIFKSITAGFLHTCGITLAGDAYCWGRNDGGYVLGNWIPYDTLLPVAVSGGHKFKQLSVSRGARFICGLIESGLAYCWGENHLALGNSAQGNRPVPTEIIGNLSFVQIAAGTRHTCALTTDGVAHCWGMNKGNLGHAASDHYDPRPVTTVLRFTKISAGLFTTCGVTQTDAAYCWGYNTGTGTKEASFSPVRVKPSPF